MKKSLKLLVGLVLTVVMVSAFFVGCSSKDYTANNTKYVIGASGPLTESAATYGIAVKRGAELAVKEINAKGGDQFEFRMEDDKAAKNDVATNFSRLYEGGMQVSLACVTSGSCLEYKTYAQQKNVFCLTPSATNDDVTKNADNMFQMCFSDNNQGAVTVEWMVSENEKGELNVPKNTRIGILYCSNDDYSRGIYNTFVATLEDDGYTINKSDIASFQNDQSGNPPTDFSSQVETLKNCQFIFMPIYYTPAATFMKAAQGIISKDAVFFGCDGFDGIDQISGFNINTIAQEVSMLSHFNANSSLEKVSAFVNAYKTAYGVVPNQFAAAAYDAVYTIASAISFAKAEGKDIPVTISASDLSDILKQVMHNETFTFHGVTGENIKWHQDGTVNKQAQKFEIKSKNA